MTLQEHRDPRVRDAITELCDALCDWERSTGIESVLVLREKGGFVFRAVNGKPSAPDDVVDAQLMKLIE